MNIFELLKYEEGYRSEPYYCSERYPTIGIGTRIGPKNADLDLYQFSVTPFIARELLNNELSDISGKLKTLDWFCKLDDDRKKIIASMAYQLGVDGLLKFKKMIAAIERRDWKLAAMEAVDSKWSKQTPKRAFRHAKVLQGKSLDEVYK